MSETPRRIPWPNPIRRVARLVRYPEERVDLRAEWWRRLTREPTLPEGANERILVICHGNICRSPFAGIDLALRNPALEIRTAGLEAGEGKPAEPTAIRVAETFQIDLGQHGSHRMNDADADWADVIIAMQGRHRKSVQERWPHAVHKVRLLGDYLAVAPHLIEDPWGRDATVFRSVFQRIQVANERLARRLDDPDART